MRLEPHGYVAAPRTGADHLPYRPDIDGLRAVAVLAVVMFHAFPGWLRGGFIGVDVFFVISGYLITSILAGAIGRRSFSIAGFYHRRVRRIFPALLVVLGASLALGWMALLPDELEQLGKHMLGAAGFASNFILWNEVGYFDTIAETKPLLHLWSLGIEEQFYVFWPAILMLAHWRRLNFMLVIGVLAAASFALNVAGLETHPSATFYSPASRAWELLAGAALAVASLGGAGGGRRLPPGAGACNLMSAAGLLMIIGAAAAITKGTHFPGWLALLPVGGAVLVIGAGPEAWINRHLLGNRVLVWIGLISYPLYLWHWPLLSFAHIVEAQTPALEVRVKAVLLSFVLAALTYWLVERPLRRGGAPRAKLALLWVLMAGVAGAGATTYMRKGFPERPALADNVQNNKELTVFEDTRNAAACKARYGFDEVAEYCLQADAATAPTVALIGDSHAYHLNAGLMKHYSAQGENMVMFSTRYPFWGLDPRGDEYQRVTDPALDIVLNTPTIHTVVISMHWWLTRIPIDHDRFNRAADATLRRFIEAGKHVIYVNVTPRMDFEPRSCIPRVALASTANRSPCAVPRAQVERQTVEHNAILGELLKKYPQVELFDPMPYLCDSRLCWAMKDGRLLYRDKTHLTYSGDLYIGEKFSEEQRRRHPQQQGKRLQ